jgi:hypothetical protein
LLAGLLKDAMDNYTSLMSQHYDDKFKVYAKAVSGSANNQFHDFMMKLGNDYFTCEVMELSMCCSYCHDCKYCFNGDCYRTASEIYSRRTVPKTKRTIFITRSWHIIAHIRSSLFSSGATIFLA